MEAAEITSMRPGDDQAAAPVRRFVIVAGEPADDGPAFRIEDPARLLRVWSPLQATLEQMAAAPADADAADGNRI
jgi:hypothetical protein